MKKDVDGNQIRPYQLRVRQPQHQMTTASHTDKKAVQNMNDLAARLASTKGVREEYARQLLRRGIKEAYDSLPQDQQKRVRMMLINQESKAFSLIQ